MLLKHPEQNPAVLDAQEDDYYKLAVAYVSIKIVLSLRIIISASQLKLKCESSSRATMKKKIIIHFYFDCQNHNSQEFFVAIHTFT